MHKAHVINSVVLRQMERTPSLRREGTLSLAFAISLNCADSSLSQL